ncbi:MAG TPA: SCO family protein [Ignavibacteriaceae bacterium]|nr:SCO family protein [Ignavibacteriaceae bacterium]
MKKFGKYLLFFFLMLNSLGFADNPKEKINIEEHLGKQIPLDVSFKDAYGNDVSLKSIVNKTTILAFVYYKCPGICSPLMSEISNIVNKSDLVPGKDYDIVTISMDERENPKIAYEKRQNFLSLINKPFPKDAWKFLTGDSVSIHTVTEAAGFHFERVGTQFIHTTCVIFISPGGKISRYLYPDYNKKGEFGILPFDFKMAVLDASEGKVMPTVGRILAFCFSYDPSGKKYVFNLLKVFGAGTLLLVAVFAVYLKVKKPKKV